MPSKIKWKKAVTPLTADQAKNFTKVAIKARLGIEVSGSHRTKGDFHFRVFSLDSGDSIKSAVWNVEHADGRTEKVSGQKLSSDKYVPTKLIPADKQRNRLPYGKKLPKAAPPERYNTAMSLSTFASRLDHAANKTVIYDGTAGSIKKRNNTTLILFSGKVPGTAKVTDTKKPMASWVTLMNQLPVGYLMIADNYTKLKKHSEVSWTINKPTSNEKKAYKIFTDGNYFPFVRKGFIEGYMKVGNSIPSQKRIGAEAFVITKPFVTKYKALLNPTKIDFMNPSATGSVYSKSYMTLMKKFLTEIKEATGDTTAITGLSTLDDLTKEVIHDGVPMSFFVS